MGLERRKVYVVVNFPACAALGEEFFVKGFFASGLRYEWLSVNVKKVSDFIIF